jgi:hypothetical protein
MDLESLYHKVETVEKNMNVLSKEKQSIVENLKQN